VIEHLVPHYEQPGNDHVREQPGNDHVREQPGVEKYEYPE
jgi:hypothetical protein